MGINSGSLETLEQRVSKYAKSFGVENVLQIKPHSLKEVNFARLKLAPLEKDIFISSDKSLNSLINEFCFDDFSKKFKKYGKSEKDLIKLCKEKYIGEGSHAKIYDIPINGMDNYVLRINNNGHLPEKLKFMPVEDKFPEHNFGQAVAQAGEKYQILKKVNGDDIGIPKNLTDLNQIQNRYVQNLKYMASMKQEAYDNLAKNLICINGKDYIFDAHAFNIKIDRSAETFNVFDLLHKSKTPYNSNDGGDIVNPLLSMGKEFFEISNIPNYFDSEIVKSRKQVLGKIIKAFDRTNINLPNFNNPDMNFAFEHVGLNNKWDDIERKIIAKRVLQNKEYAKEVVSRVLGEIGRQNYNRADIIGKNELLEKIKSWATKNYIDTEKHLQEVFDNS